MSATKRFLEELYYDTKEMQENEKIQYMESIGMDNLNISSALELFQYMDM